MSLNTLSLWHKWKGHWEPQLAQFGARAQGALVQQN